MSRKSKLLSGIVIVIVVAVFAFLMHAVLEYFNFEVAFNAKPSIWMTNAERRRLQPRVHSTVANLQGQRAYWADQLSTCEEREKNGQRQACQEAEEELAFYDRQVSEAVSSARWYEFSIPAGQ